MSQKHFRKVSETSKAHIGLITLTKAMALMIFMGQGVACSEAEDHTWTNHALTNYDDTHLMHMVN